MKKLTAIFLALLLTLPLMAITVSAATFNTTPNAEGMYAHYQLNEIKDGKVIDSINGNNGEVVNDGVIANDPQRGNVLYLDGTDQYIHLPDGITKDLKAWTISAWYKCTDPDDRSWQRVFDFGRDTEDNFFCTARSGADTIRFATKLNSIYSGYGEDIFDGPKPIFDEWVHVAVTMGGGKTAFYVNGELMDEYGSDHTPDQLDNSSQNYLGNAQYNDPYFMGYLDDVILFNKALSAAEVKTLMNRDFNAEDATPEPEPVVAPAVTPATTSPTTAPRTADTTIILMTICIFAAVALLKIRKAKAN